MHTLLASIFHLLKYPTLSRQCETMCLRVAASNDALPGLGPD